MILCMKPNREAHGITYGTLVSTLTMIQQNDSHTMIKFLAFLWPLPSPASARVVKPARAIKNKHLVFIFTTQTKEERGYGG